MFFGHLVAVFDAVLCYAVPLRIDARLCLRISVHSFASAYHCLSLRCNAVANRCFSMRCPCQRFLASPLRICALACHRLQNLSMPRPSCHFPTMPLLCQPNLCLRTTMPDSPVQCPRCHSLTLPLHPIYAPYASAHHIGVHLFCAVANQNYAIASQNLSLPCLCIAYPSYAHCNSVESYAFAILCLAPIRCAIALNLCAFP